MALKLSSKTPVTPKLEDLLELSQDPSVTPVTEVSNLQKINDLIRLKSAEIKNKYANQPRSSVIQLLGDTFAKTPLTRGYLLEDLNDDTGGNALTNTGSISLARVEDDLPLRGFPVPTLNGTDQYFSKATDADLEVGTNSFLVSIWFKTTTSGTQYLFQYGNRAASEQHWSIRINANNLLELILDDGTNTDVLQDTTSTRFDDNKWHIAVGFVDKSTTRAYLLAGDNPSELKLLKSGTVTATNSLDNSGESLLVGASFTGSTVVNYFTGQLSNFQLYNMGTGSEDYNLPAVLAAGIRESAFGSAGSLSLLSSTSRRLNNIFRLSNNNFAHTTGVIHTDEGLYDLLELYDTNLNHAISEISIDGIVHSITDRYSASAAYNVKKITRGIFLSEGSHIFKLRHNGKNANSSGFFSTTNMIELIKRDGNLEGGATSFNLFGDEINERTNNSNITGDVQTSSIFNNIFGTHSTANASNRDFTEGDLFLKRGLWKITYTGVISSDFGHLDVDFGSVKVFDQLDLYKSTLQRNKQFTRFVRLAGGKTNIKLAINGKNASSTDFRFGMNSLRGELVSGNGMGDKVEIFGFDNDFETVNGATISSPHIVTSYRFNGRAVMLNANLTEHLYRRYFSGGVYRVKFIYPLQSNLGILDVGLDANGATDIFNQLDQYSNTTERNIEAFTTIQITRGFHDIHFKTNGKNASSSGYYNIVQLLQFQLIGRNGSTEDEDSENGNEVLLARYIARKAEGSAVFSLADVDMFNKYSQLKILFDGEITAGLKLQCKINGIGGTSNTSKGFKASGSTLTNIAPGAAAQLQFAGTSIAFANARLHGEANFQWNEAGTPRFMGESKFYNSGADWDEMAHFVVDSSGKLKSLEVKTSTSTWKTLSKIEIKGSLIRK